MTSASMPSKNLRIWWQSRSNSLNPYEMPVVSVTDILCFLEESVENGWDGYTTVKDLITALTEGSDLG